MKMECLPLFHVVLNNVFFGSLSLSDGNWVADEPRPAALIEATGKEVEKYLRSKGKHG